MKANLFFNPFNRIAGKEAAFWGLLFLLIIAIIGYFANLVFPATLDIKFKSETSSIQILLLLQSSLLTILTFWISAVLFSKSVRFIDIVGTILFAKWPYIVASLVLWIMPMKQSNSLDPIMILVILLVILLFVVPSVILHVALLYNAFKVSTGLKDVKLNVVFTFTLLIAETLSFVSAYLILEGLTFTN